MHVTHTVQTGHNYTAFTHFTNFILAHLCEWNELSELARVTPSSKIEWSKQSGSLLPMKSSVGQGRTKCGNREQVSE